MAYLNENTWNDSSFALIVNLKSHGIVILCRSNFGSNLKANGEYSKIHEALA